MQHDPGPQQVAFAVQQETLPWERDPDPSMSRRQRLAARGPYQAAVPQKIADAVVRLSLSVQAEAEDAVREITRFDAEVADMSAWTAGEDAVELAPLASVLLRTESASSSQIEGITAGARALALAAIEEKAGSNALLVGANVDAMRSAMSLADDISVDSVLAAHKALLGDQPYSDAGSLRSGQVWIGSAAMSPHTAAFVPPHQARVPELMADLIAFARRVDLPVLPQIAITHAQFETIHPFNDGNGRTGRALVHAMLRHAGVTQRLTLPISAGLLADTDAYFDALGQYRQGHLEPIVEQFCVASMRAVANGRGLVAELEGVYRAWSQQVSSRRGSAARRLLPFLLNQPAVDVKVVAGMLSVTITAAQRAVEQLESAGVLVRASANKRNRVWLASEVIDALDRFAERAGRRS